MTARELDQVAGEVAEFEAREEERLTDADFIGYGPRSVEAYTSELMLGTRRAA